MRHILPETMCEGVWFHQEVRVHIERSHPACVVGDLVSERLHDARGTRLERIESTAVIPMPSVKGGQ